MSAGIVILGIFGMLCVVIAAVIAIIFAGKSSEDHTERNSLYATAALNGAALITILILMIMGSRHTSEAKSITSDIANL